MSPNTIFRSADALEPKSLDEAISQVEQSKFEQDVSYAKEIEIKFIPEANEFEGVFGGRTARFSKIGFLRLCGAVGIPAGFAEKVPNDLLITNIEELLAGFEAKKLKMIYRGNIVVDATKPGKCWVHPKTSIEYLAAGLKARNLISDRIVVTNDGVVANAYETPTTQFDLGADPFDLGIKLDYGYSKPGLLTSGFFSRRHACLNIAYAMSSKTMQKNIGYERLRGTENFANSYGRFHERLTLPCNLVPQVKQAHMVIKGQKLEDEGYLTLYKQLSKIIGHEPTLGVFQVTEDQHELYTTTVKTRKAMLEVEPSANVGPVSIDSIELYTLLNKLTSLAQAYKGEDRLKIESLGGTLLPL